MVDIVSPEKRSQMMAGIRGKDTKPEMIVRRGLHRIGFRYRLHDKRLPGKPDLVFPKFRAVVFVHGCFWHCHKCHLFKLPTTRPRFWKTKLNRNQELDREHIHSLNDAGWRVLVIWECALKGRTKVGTKKVLDISSRWLIKGTSNLEVSGTSNVNKSTL